MEQINFVPTVQWIGLRKYKFSTLAALCFPTKRRLFGRRSDKHGQFLYEIWMSFMVWLAFTPSPAVFPGNIQWAMIVSGYLGCKFPYSSNRACSTSTLSIDKVESSNCIATKYPLHWLFFLLVLTNKTFMDRQVVWGHPAGNTCWNVCHISLTDCVGFKIIFR